MVPGALATAFDLGALAELLAARHTVHVVQRRGRGDSGPQGDRYSIASECADIEAIRARTDARLIFGHSFGGLVALRAACANPAFDAVAVYEPGVSVDKSIPTDWTDRARRELAAGNNFEAFLTFIRGINPSQTGRIPRWFLRIILRHAIPHIEMEQNLALMPQAVNEHIEVGHLDARLSDYHEITANTLIMHGKGRRTSRQILALTQLGATIPDCEISAFPTLDHFAPEKTPEQITTTVLQFFATHARTDTTIRRQ
ncbi:alpha/beta hydrolase [Nocardia sp. NPDC046763]|uniref:alpha/beta fold hydrolase n=1 Tax=Nocardia sp. NPDC046763 TaxID=3155256 RepID=UPI0033C16C3A